MSEGWNLRHMGLDPAQKRLREALCALGNGVRDARRRLGAMGGTVDIVMRHYAGLELARGGVRLAPDMPRQGRRSAFRSTRPGSKERLHDDREGERR